MHWGVTRTHAHTHSSPLLFYGPEQKQGNREVHSKMKEKAEEAKMGEEMRECGRGRVGGTRKRGRAQKRWQSSAENGRCNGHHIKGPALSGRSDRGASVCMCVDFCTCCSGGCNFPTTYLKLKSSSTALGSGLHMKPYGAETRRRKFQK